MRGEISIRIISRIIDIESTQRKSLFAVAILALGIAGILIIITVWAGVQYLKERQAEESSKNCQYLCSYPVYFTSELLQNTLVLGFVSAIFGAAGISLLVLRKRHKGMAQTNGSR